MPTGTADAARLRAEGIVRRLVEAGHEAYLCGGCVRDGLRGVRPIDHDIATSARPDEVEALFECTHAVGARFGVILVVVEDQPFEVATFRTESGYQDGRRPSEVAFAGPREDVARRDFTINGLLLDPLTDSVVDLVGGRADLESGTIRTIGEPADRFAEDRLRLLRAVRFAAGLGFEIEPATWDALVDAAGEIGCVSGERIRDELLKILGGPDPGRGIDLLVASGLAAVVLPEAGQGTIGRAVAAGLTPPEDPLVVLAALLTGVRPEAAEALGRRLRLSNAERGRLVGLVAGGPVYDAGLDLATADRKRRLRAGDVEAHLRLLAARLRAADQPLDLVDAWRSWRDGWSADDLHPRPLLDGADVLALGAPRGPLVGRILAEIEEGQLAETLTDRPAAVALARRRIDAGDTP